jgi:hypothetical protein
LVALAIVGGRLALVDAIARSIAVGDIPQLARCSFSDTIVVSSHGLTVI